MKTSWLQLLRNRFHYRLQTRRSTRRLHRARLSTEALEPRQLLATFTVSSLDDAGAGTLRQAVEAANMFGDPVDDIVFQSNLAGTITLTTGEIPITSSININGPGSGAITVNGNNASRIFNVNDNSAAIVNVSIAGLTLTGGNAGNGNDGGAIRSLENLSIADSVITGNVAGRDGGGVFLDASSNSHVISISNTEFSQNQADPELDDFGEGGGVLLLTGGVVNISGTTLSGNFSAGQGGGVLTRLFPGANVAISNSTISGNTTEGAGGGLLIDGTGQVTVTSTTITGNTSDTDNSGGGDTGGGIHVDAGTLTLRNSIVAANTDNTATAPDIDDSASLITTIFNLIGNNAGSSLIEAPVGSPDPNGNLIGGPTNGVINPMLGPPANNGGTTLTHLPLPGSPAQDTGESFGINIDQRGVVRPNGPKSDMGSVEFIQLPTMQPQSFALLENQTPVGTVSANATDLPGDFLTFTIAGTGVDDALFTITPGGMLSFLTPPDFENPADDDEDNQFHVDVRVTNIASDTVTATMTVNVVNQEFKPAIINPADFDAAGGQLTLRRNGTNFEVADTQTAALLQTFPVNDVFSIVINGRDGAGDTLTVDFGGGSLDDIFYHAGTGGADFLILNGGNFGGVTYNHANSSDGDILLANGTTTTITFTGLEPVIDNLPALDRAFNFNGGGESITLSDNSFVNDGRSFIDSTAAEEVTFINPSRSLSVNAGGGSDSISVTTLDAFFGAQLSIDGGGDTGDAAQVSNIAVNGTGGIGLTLTGLDSASVTNSSFNSNIGAGIVSNSVGALTVREVSADGNGGSGLLIDGSGSSSVALVESSSFNFNDNGVFITGGAMADLGQPVPGVDFTGLGISSGGNDFTSYVAGAPFNPSGKAIVNDNTNSPNNLPGAQGLPFDVPAFGNSFFSFSPANIDQVILHDLDESTRGLVDFLGLSDLEITARLFYNNSAYDGNGAAVTAADFAAIATDKTALVLGETADSTNISSYDKGLNGFFIDVPNLPNNGAAIDAADFMFMVGNDNFPDTWPNAPAPTAVDVLPGQGDNGADRIYITFADGAIRQTWLRIVVKANADTSLAIDKSFFFGSAPGETGNNTPPTEVNVDAFDFLSVAANLTPTGNQGTESITQVNDSTKDATVDAFDFLAIAANLGLDVIDLITPQLGAPGSAMATATATNATARDLLFAKLIKGHDSSKSVIADVGSKHPSNADPYRFDLPTTDGRLARRMEFEPASHETRDIAVQSFAAGSNGNGDWLGPLSREIEL